MCCFGGILWGVYVCCCFCCLFFVFVLFGCLFWCLFVCFVGFCLFVFNFFVALWVFFFVDYAACIVYDWKCPKWSEWFFAQVFSSWAILKGFLCYFSFPPCFWVKCFLQRFCLLLSSPLFQFKWVRIQQGVLIPFLTFALKKCCPWCVGESNILGLMPARSWVCSLEAMAKKAVAWLMWIVGLVSQ